MKLNIKKFMMTEMGGELEETIKAWDQALEERRKATPGIGDPNQGLGFGYWDCTCKSCQDRWEVFKLAIRQFYGIEFNFTRTDEYFGICNDDETIWLMKENREEERQVTKKRSTDIRTCPVCGHTVQRSDMQFTRDCNGIPFRLVCWD